MPLHGFINNAPSVTSQPNRLVLFNSYDAAYLLCGQSLVGSAVGHSADGKYFPYATRDAQLVIICSVFSLFANITRFCRRRGIHMQYVTLKWFIFTCVTCSYHSDLLQDEEGVEADGL